jgi:hypothetical protein
MSSKSGLLTPREPPTSEKPISPVRWRMLDDMAMRRFTTETERYYIRSTPELGEFLARPGRADS